MDTNHQRRSIAVLIVEDEPLIRINACSLIEEAGFTVFEAKDADEAIRLLEGNDEVGLIFTDIQMPGSMDGISLAHYVSDHWPPVKIIVTSGQIKEKSGDLPAGAIFVPKPYGSVDLANRVKKLVAG